MFIFLGSLFLFFVSLIYLFFKREFLKREFEEYSKKENLKNIYK